jgi:hypothetical protein
MGLAVEPMTTDQLWSALWERFNEEEAPPIPQLTVFDGEEITEIVNSDVHLTSDLFSGQDIFLFLVPRITHPSNSWNELVILADGEPGNHRLHCGTRTQNITRSSSDINPKNV